MKKFFLVNIIGCVVLMSSCNKFLTPEPLDKYSEEVAFKSESNARLYVNSFYPILSYYGLFGGSYLGGNMYVDGLTDIIKAGGSTIGTNGAIANIYATTPGEITPDQNSLSIWDNAYYYIRLINEFLVGLDKSSLSPQVKTQLSGEARFFRGYLYFLLMRNHGSVILLTELTTDKNHPRSDSDSCWNQIEADLEFAAKSLPESWPADNVGRITKGAARAMESRALLYAQRWQVAYDAGDDVLKLADKGLYDLNATYARAFRSYASGNKESILEFNYSYPKLTHGYDGIASPGDDNPLYPYGGAIQPTQELVEMYEKAGGGTVDWSTWHKDNVTENPPYEQLEPRFQATVLYNGAEWKGRQLEIFVGGSSGWIAYPPAGGNNRGASETGYFLKKYLDSTHTDLVNIKSDQAMIEIRLAEVYLNMAEAAYHLGKTADANHFMNVVRNRAGLPNLKLSADKLLTQIKKERTIEFAGEDQHYWDLRRWHDADKVLTAMMVHGLKISKTGTTFSYNYISCDDNDRTFPAKLYNFPIPSTELNNNTSCTQLAGW